MADKIGTGLRDGHARLEPRDPLQAVIAALLGLRLGAVRIGRVLARCVT